MDFLKATRKRTTETARTSCLADKNPRVDTARISEQLKKISELNLDDFTRPSGNKFENTVREMFSIIKDLEKHLQDMLALNTTLRTELRERHQEGEKLRQAKEEAERKIAVLERDFPRVRDLEQQLEMAAEEISQLRLQYKLEKEKQEKNEAAQRRMAALAEKTKEERDDAYREIAGLSGKLKFAPGTR